jgi:adenosylmethionine-8-amino-7-oxononanoate aminotransferase
LAGWCVGNLGWDHREIRTAIRNFRGPDYVYPGFGYRRWEELAELLASIVPVRNARCFRATGGSEAVELALQAAMLHTGRQGFLSLEDSYHGNTLGTLSVGASESRKSLKNLLPHCRKIEPPLDGKAAGKVEAMLRKHDVAAFIMEPISINLGGRGSRWGIHEARARGMHPHRHALYCRRGGLRLRPDRPALRLRAFRAEAGHVVPG